MPVFVFAADVGFVNFNDAAKLFLRLYHRGADFVAHQVRRIVGAEAHLPLNLQGADALFAGGHKVHDLEPLAERLVGVLKNRADQNREAIALRIALLALPMPLAGLQVINGGVATARADNAVRPAAGLQVGFAGVLVPLWEHILKLCLGHLMDRLRTLCHGSYPFNPMVKGYCHGRWLLSSPA